eukprot:CAMPEP_0178941764 /NCGR_PEP_ID=MMETSP0789-20121207/1597_1 /TAXON_ID=3005 /ORGANISM="Rhizosolenia setigera, Strain CCMP 1694" /LENGTH=464 /DNA_ID=CAMNT_0020621053 /DNA_START=18 /DNA_END=1408 /DNA_ORIENTATION=+
MGSINTVPQRRQNNTPQPSLAANILELRSSSSWTQKQSLPDFYSHHPIAFANETHAFVFSGSTPSSQVTKTFLMYTEETDNWTDLTDTNSQFPGAARSFGYGVVLNEFENTKAYVGFGVDENYNRLNDLWEFDMKTHDWKQLASLPWYGRRHPAMVSVLNSQTQKWEIHVGLGDSVDTSTNSFFNMNDYWIYDIAGDSWEQQPTFPGNARHHPFFFSLGGVGYAGLGHSSGYDPYIERDFYKFEDGAWIEQSEFASYAVEADLFKSDDTVSSLPLTLSTTEARVAGTEFSIELPAKGAPDENNPELKGSLGFVLSGDGDNHNWMETGEFHAFYPPTDPLLEDITDEDTSKGLWVELPSHPGNSRWAPSSFVMRNSARVYFTSGYDRSSQSLKNDLWMIDLSPLFCYEEVMKDEDEIPITIIDKDSSLSNSTLSNSTLSNVLSLSKNATRGNITRENIASSCRPG